MVEQREREGRNDGEGEVVQQRQAKHDRCINCAALPKTNRKNEQQQQQDQQRVLSGKSP